MNLTEPVIIWSSAIFIMAVIILPYGVKFRKHVKHSTHQKKEAHRLGIEKPLAQHPIIDVNRCIGCASCVRACPEGGVLGIVDGYAQIINGMRCIGHGECEKACPVKGIYMGMGDLSQRDDIPALKNHRETNIPGIYIIGELGGLALIRNAIKQGVETVNHIAALNQPVSNHPDAVDLCIVGAGPAGLSAALSAKKEGLSFRLIDQQGAGGTILQYPKKKLVLTQPVDLPLYGRLKKNSYLKEDLLAIWRDIQTRFDINVEKGVVLKTIQGSIGSFEVITNQGPIHAKRVVLALGRRGTPRKLGIPGENLSKVAYKLIDAQSYQNNRILIVGGGDSAIEAALGLCSQKGNEVTLSYRKDQFFRIKKRNEVKLNSVLKRNRLQIIFKSQPVEIQPKFVSLKTESGVQKIENDFVFVFAGGTPPYPVLKQIGIDFGESA